MDTVVNGSSVPAKVEEERARHEKRLKLKESNLNPNPPAQDVWKDSSLKRHTALIKRIRQSLAVDNRDQILKDIDTLSLEKYIDEIANAIIEGISRCKTERDVWAAVEVISALHSRFPKIFMSALLPLLSGAISAPNKAQLNALAPEQREKEESVRVTRQRPLLRVCTELALVGLIQDAPGRSGGEWIMKAIKELLSNDPNLGSLPLLTTFLKAYSRPCLGLTPPATTKQADGTSGSNAAFPVLGSEQEELVEQEIRDRFKRMCEGYYDNVAKKLVIEHKRLQEQDKRNHEAYIRSGEIFEDRQQAYEKMTKNYEKLLGSCQSLSELLYIPLPALPTASQKSDSILIGAMGSSGADNDQELTIVGGKWEDEEERRFFEDIQDLKDFVPSSVLGLEKDEADEIKSDRGEEEDKEDLKKLEEELDKLSIGDPTPLMPEQAMQDEPVENEIDDSADAEAATPKAGTPPLSPHLTPQGPSQLLTALLLRLPEATNRSLMDQAAIDFAFLNSKAARKRLVKFLGQVPKNRIDLLAHYSRLVAILNRYMPDIGKDIIAILEEEFRYLQRKKNVHELSEVRNKNIAFLSNLTKFGVVPSHVILHMFKVCLDDFSGTNVETLAGLLEGCGRFLLRNEETSARFGTMLELMKRKQSMQRFDQRQLLLLENAYYQCNPPERGPKEVKQRTPMELFIRHLLFDVLSKKTIDKALKLIRKLNWENEEVQTTLFKIFTKPWKITYSNISLLAMLTYDLQRYYPAFTVSVVDQVLEDTRRGMEQNVYTYNQRRMATMKYLGELYIYRLFSSSIIFDTLWSLVTYGHPDGRPLPKQTVPLDMPDDFFRVRLVCVLLDTCGMCFDRGTQKKKLDNFLVFFQYYVHCKDPLPMDVDFMVSDSLEAVRPKLQMAKSIEEAAVAVDQMFNAAYHATNEDSGDDSGDEIDDDRFNVDGQGDDDDDDATEGPDSPVNERAPSPDTEIILSSSNSMQENLGPTLEADAEFAKELVKLMTDNSSDSRRVDKRTALALWDSAVIPPNARKKKVTDSDDDTEVSQVKRPDMNTMAFTVITKRGNKQQTRQLAVPSESPLAVHTRSAQLQDKVEQEHLKRLVLDYEQREEAEEQRAIEARSRPNVIKIRIAG